MEHILGMRARENHISLPNFAVNNCGLAVTSLDV